MRIEFAPPPPPPKPQTSWLSVFALAFVIVWASMLGFAMWGPGEPPIERFVSVLAQHWRDTQQQTSQQQAPQDNPSLRASFHSGAPSAAILGGRVIDPTSAAIAKRR